MMTFTARTPKTFAKYIALMKQYHLYSSRYSGYGKLIYDDYCLEHISTIKIVKHNGIPIAVAILFNEPVMFGCNVTCFVKPAYRRRGIGSKLVNSLVSKEQIVNFDFPDDFPK